MDTFAGKDDSLGKITRESRDVNRGSGIYDDEVARDGYVFRLLTV